MHRLDLVLTPLYRVFLRCVYRLDKILKIETQIQEGKVLDEEQKIMYSTKSSVEKSLSDLKAILSAFEEVAKEVLRISHLLFCVTVPHYVPYCNDHIKKERESGAPNGHSHLDGEEECKGSDVRANPTLGEPTADSSSSKKAVAVVEEEPEKSTDRAELTTLLLKAIHVFSRCVA